MLNYDNGSNRAAMGDLVGNWRVLVSPHGHEEYPSTVQPDTQPPCRTRTRKHGVWNTLVLMVVKLKALYF